MIANIIPNSCQLLPLKKGFFINIYNGIGVLLGVLWNIIILKAMQNADKQRLSAWLEGNFAQLMGQIYATDRAFMRSKDTLKRQVFLYGVNLGNYFRQRKGVNLGNYIQSTRMRPVMMYGVKTSNYHQRVGVILGN